MANWMFKSPTTSSSKAMSRVAQRISRSISSSTSMGGRMQAESPEWMPARSMCCMTPAT